MAATTTSLPRPTVKTKPLPLRPSSASVVMTTYAEDNRGSLFIASEPDSVLDVGETQVVGFDSGEGAHVGSFASMVLDVLRFVPVIHFF